MVYQEETFPEDNNSGKMNTFLPLLFALLIFSFILIGTILAVSSLFDESFTFSSPEDLERARYLGTNTWYKRIKNKCAYAIDGYLGTYYFTPGWYYPYVVSNSSQNYATLIKKNFEQRFRRMPWLNIGTVSVVNDSMNAMNRTATISEPELNINGQNWLLQTRYDPMRNLFTYRVIRPKQYTTERNNYTSERSKYMWLKEHGILRTGDYVHRIRYPLVKMRVKLFN